MRRFMSFRDFDWDCCSDRAGCSARFRCWRSYSATLHTKYVGFHTKQIYWILGGVVAMFLLPRSITTS